MRFLVLVLAVLCVGCVGEPQGGTVTSTAEDAPMTTSTTLDIIVSTTTTIVDEVEEPTTTTVKAPVDLSGCMQLSGDAADECYYQSAKNGGREACNEIGGDNLKFKCLARVEDKQEYCRRIDNVEEEDYCFRMMAFRWNNIDYCYAIRVQAIRDKCLADYVKDKKPDPYVCFKIVDDSLRDGCIMQHIGLDRINPGLCYLITDGELELECNQTYLNA